MKNTDNPKVLISIVNWNNYKDTIACLESIYQYITYPNYKIVIIDNNSQNNSVEIIKKTFPECELIESTDNLGFAEGHQLSYSKFKNSGFELFWMLNNDLAVEKESLESLVYAYKKNGEAIFGSINKKNDILEKKQNIIKQVKLLTGYSYCIPFSIIEKYGFIDTSYFLYFEEYDYCLSLNKKGINSYLVTNSNVYHKGKGSSKKTTVSNIISYYYNRNRLFFEYKFYDRNKLVVLKKNNYNIFKTICYLVVLYLYLKLNYTKKSIVYFNRQYNYYNYLSILHFILSIRGKTIPPEKFYDRNTK